MTIVPLIFLSIGRQRSAEKQRAFLMTGSECAGLDVSESAAASQSREPAREVSGQEAQQHNETANLYTFFKYCVPCTCEKKNPLPPFIRCCIDLGGLFATRDPLTETFLQLVVAHR